VLLHAAVCMRANVLVVAACASPVEAPPSLTMPCVLRRLTLGVARHSATVDTPVRAVQEAQQEQLYAKQGRSVQFKTKAERDVYAPSTLLTSPVAAAAMSGLCSLCGNHWFVAVAVAVVVVGGDPRQGLMRSFDRADSEYSSGLRRHLKRQISEHRALLAHKETQLKNSRAVHTNRFILSRRSPFADARTLVAADRVPRARTRAAAFIKLLDVRPALQQSLPHAATGSADGCRSSSASRRSSECSVQSSTRSARTRPSFGTPFCTINPKYGSNADRFGFGGAGSGLGLRRDRGRLADGEDSAVAQPNAERANATVSRGVGAREGRDAAAAAVSMLAAISWCTGGCVGQ
jgi:hypothetical protein